MKRKSPPQSSGFAERSDMYDLIAPHQLATQIAKSERNGDHPMAIILDAIMLALVERAVDGHSRPVDRHRMTEILELRLRDPDEYDVRMKICGPMIAIFEADEEADERN